MTSPDSTEKSYLYNVLLTGNVRTGFEKQKVIEALAKLFQTSNDKIVPLLQGNTSLLKRDLSHQAAFQYQQKLNQVGAETLLKPHEIPQQETEFSLVPEGEEQTSYETLAERLKQGAQIRCQHCGESQIFAPYCSACGKQLKGALLEQSEISHSKQTSKVKQVCFVLGILAILVAVLDVVRIVLKILPGQQISWFAPLSFGIGILLVFFANRGKGKPSS